MKNCGDSGIVTRALVHELSELSMHGLHFARGSEEDGSERVDVIRRGISHVGMNI